jgi:hypothetical protein
MLRVKSGDIGGVFDAREIEHFDRVATGFECGRHAKNAEAHEHALIQQKR